MRTRVKKALESGGDPFTAVATPKNGNGHAVNGASRKPSAAELKFLSGYYNSYMASLGLIGAPALVRAGDPFSNNPWVFSAAMVAAIASSQAPLKIFRETDRGQELRRLEAKKFGRKYSGPRAGKARRAFGRHLRRSIDYRISWTRKGVEEDLDHELYDVLLRKPNPYQTGGQLRQFTILNLSLKLECMWHLCDAEGRGVGPGQIPEQIWPYSPDYFEPILEHGTYGRQVAWWFTPPRWSPTAVSGSGVRTRLELHEVVHFKFPNPNNPVRAVARLTPVAPAIEMDELAAAQQRALLKRGATPKGIMTYDGQIDTKDVEDKEKEFEEKYVGSDNSGETLFLHGGWKYQVVGLTPDQMQNKQMLEWNREAELAVMATPLSALGLAGKDTYAAELLARKSLWDLNVIPMFMLVEETLDCTLFYPETDDVFAGFDLKDVEALRAGVEHKVTIADKMAGSNLHTPPKVAYATVGLEVEEYPGDDKALVSPMLMSAEDVVAGVMDDAGTNPDGTPQDPNAPTDPDAPPPGTPNDGNVPDDAGEKRRPRTLDQRIEDAVSRALKNYPGRTAGGPAASTTAQPVAPAVLVRESDASRILKAKNRWVLFEKLERTLERPMKSAYRGWVAQMRRELFRRFDEAMGLKADSVDLTGIIPDPDWMKAELKKKARGPHVATQQATYDFTKDEIGVPVFDIQDDRFRIHFNERENLFAGEVTETLIRNVKGTLTEGMQAGETIQQLRSRLGEVLNVADGSAKTLTVARTETAGFMNGMRDEMFGAQGFGFGEWVSAGDEHVRDSHVLYGEAGPKARGFNYLSLSGKAGQLRHPGDMEAPADEVINCRCLQIPADEPKARTSDEIPGRQASAAPAPQPLHVHLHQQIIPMVPAPELPPQPHHVDKEITYDEKGRAKVVRETPVYPKDGGEGQA